MVSADDQVVVEMHLSGGDHHDGPEGRISLATVGKNHSGVPVLMDRAYEGNETRALAAANGHKPIVPPKKNRTQPWKYNKKLYKRRNMVERAIPENKSLPENLHSLRENRCNVYGFYTIRLCHYLV